MGSYARFWTCKIILLSLFWLAPCKVLAWQDADVEVAAFNPSKEGAEPFDGHAFKLSSSHREFGGLSGAAWLGDRLYMISDNGTLWRARAVFGDDRRLTDLVDWQTAAIRKEGKPIGKLDFEALSATPDGRLFAAIEGQHQIFELLEEGDHMLAQPLGLPEILSPSPINRGIEALTTRNGKTFLAISEGLLRDDGGHAAVIVKADGKPIELSYTSASGFDPTDAAWTDDDHIYVLERRYGLMSGWQARLADMHITADVARRTEVLRFPASFTMDNFEGLAIRKDHRSTYATIVSDDNFFFLQSTLIFDLPLP